MSLLRVRQVVPLEGWKLRLTLSDGSIVERTVAGLMAVPIFGPLKADPELFSQRIAELMKPSVARDAHGAGFLLSCGIDSVHNRGAADDGL